MCSVIKRKFALCMALVMLLTLLAGCHEDVETASRGTISDFESQAHIQVSTPDDESTPEEVSQAPLTGEFVVSEKKYDYKDDNLMLLYVENQTNRHYNVTINGKYLDENGNVIKEESQTFGAFPAGWSNHFIFYPRCKFDSFTYELETDDYTKEVFYTADKRRSLTTSDSDGNPLASYIELGCEKKLDWMRMPIGDMANPDEGRAMICKAIFENKHRSVTIVAQYHVLILDTDGNIYIADYEVYDKKGVKGSSRASAEPVGGAGDENNLIFLKEQPRGADETIPDNVQGVFTPIFAIIEVYDDDAFMEEAKKWYEIDYGKPFPS